MQPSPGSKDSPVQPGRMNWAFGCGWGRLGKAREAPWTRAVRRCVYRFKSIQLMNLWNGYLLFPWSQRFRRTLAIRTLATFCWKNHRNFSGSTYADFLEREIFGPAGIKDSALESQLDLI
ncbi:hypothetical protein PVOR_03255 [Paenibacillus vortex V453]|uniref:Uncharacterized protein n=1 Tax=Paenibacillus vortex V453 TaxID=715225 RepID=A0A2R9T182_9BACL|nr:hypothetical protein PVOR_03255 [Paenibacillus vortex V453]